MEIRAESPCLGEWQTVHSYRRPEIIEARNTMFSWSLKRLLLLCVSSALVCTFAQDVTALRSIRKVYIEKMPNDLDQYLRAEIVKQFKGSLTVVLDKGDADGILTGIDEEKTGTGAQITGRYLGLHDNATRTISMLDKAEKTVLWTDEAGDRSLVFGVMKRGGQRKVADRLIAKLKKAMEAGDTPSSTKSKIKDGIK